MCREQHITRGQCVKRPGQTGRLSLETSRGHLQPTTTDESSCLSPSLGHLLLLLPEPWWLSRKGLVSCKMAQFILSVWQLSPSFMGHGTWLALETKEYPARAAASVFRAVCLHPSARSGTLAMAVAQVDIKPVPSTWSLSTEMNKLPLREEWEGICHRSVEANPAPPCLCITSWVTLLQQ